MSRNLFPTGSQSAYSDYVQGLSDAITHRDWVYDPSFALQSDRSIYEKVLRDPVAAHAIRFRKHLVAAAEVRVIAASEEPEDEAAATIIEDLLKNICGFTDARICLADAIFTGSSYAMVLGRRRIQVAGTVPGGARAQPQDWFVPERLDDIDRRRFRLVNYDGGTLRWELWSVKRAEWEPLKNPEWFIRSVYDETESSLGYGRGLLDTLYFYQASKARTMQDSLAASERFGQGMLTVAIENMRGADGRPVGGDTRSGSAVAAAWQRELSKQRARHILVHDARDTINAMNGLGEGWQLLQWILGYLDNAQVTAVLGSTLPTIEGDGGSRAMAQVQENSTEALVQADRQRLADDLTRDLVGLLWRLNSAQIMGQVGQANMPRLSVDQRKLDDPVESATLIATLLAAGVPLRAKEVYEKIGFTPPLPGDDTIGGSPAGEEGAIDPMADLAAFLPGLGAPLAPVAPVAPLAPAPLVAPPAPVAPVNGSALPGLPSPFGVGARG